MKITTESRNNVFDILKGLAVVLVVYGHVIQRSMVLAGKDFFLHPVFKIIYMFHMPLFIFISGYLLASSLQRRAVIEVFRSRYKSLFIPLFTWGMFGILTSILLDGFDGKSFALSISWDFVDYLAGSMEVWFIWFLFTLFVSSILLLLCEYLKPWFGQWIFIVGYFLIMAIPFNGVLSFYYVKWFYLFYLAGYFFNRFGTRIISRCNTAAVFMVCLTLFIVLAVFWTKNDYVYVNKMSFFTADYVVGMLRLCYRYLAGFLGIGIMFFIGSVLAKTKVAKFLSYIGIYSLDVYLLQRYLVEGLYPRLLARANLNFDFNSPFFLLVFTPAVVMAAIVICLTISKMVFRKIPLANMLFLGNRH